MGLRLQNMFPWGQYLENAINFLEDCEEAPPSDKLLCFWARIQHQADDADGLFFINGTVPNRSKALQSSEKRLHSYGKQIAESKSCECLVSLCPQHVKIFSPCYTAVRLKDTLTLYRLVLSN